MKRLELTGQRFGSWLVLGPVGVDRHRNVLWSCICDCGEVSTVQSASLRNGRSTKCRSCSAPTRARAATAARILPNSRITYCAVHLRLRTLRGRASAHICPCGKPAEQWAYQHGDPQERLGQDRRGHPPMLFTPNLDAYAPMCVPCHKRFDRQHTQVNDSAVPVTGASK